MNEKLFSRTLNWYFRK